MANKLKVIAEIIPGGDDFYVVTSDNVGVGNQSLTAALENKSDLLTVTKVYNTVSDMKNDSTLTSNTKCSTIGYYDENDGGGAIYKITSEEPDAFYESLSNGLFASLLYGNEINIKTLGFKEGSDNTYATLNKNIFQNAIDTIKTFENRPVIFIPSGIYPVINGINCDYAIHMKGVTGTSQIYLAMNERYQGTVLMDYGTSSDPFISFTGRQCGPFISDIVFEGYNKPNHDGLYFNNCGWEMYLSNVSVKEFSGNGITLYKVYDSYINNITILGCGGNSGKYSLLMDSDSSDAVNAIHINSLHIESSKRMIKASRTRQTTFVNCKFEAGSAGTYAGAPILFDKTVQDIQFVGCTFITYNSSIFNINNYFFEYLGDTSLSRLIINACEFFCSVNGSHKILKVKNGCITGNSFTMVSAKDTAFNLESCLFNGNTISLNTSENVSDYYFILNRTNVNGNKFLNYTAGATCTLFKLTGGKNSVNNNSINEYTYSRYFEDESYTNCDNVEREGVFEINSNNCYEILGVDASETSGQVCDLDLNKCRGAKNINLNLNFGVVFKNITGNIGNDKIIISNSSAMYIEFSKEGSIGSKINFTGSLSPIVFGTQIAKIEYYRNMWNIVGGTYSYNS